MRIAGRIAVLGGCFMLALGVAAHASAPAQDAPKGPVASATPDASALAYGRTLFEKKCTGCHVASQTTSRHKTADEWAATVDQMMGFGAQVSDAEYPKLVEYLAATYGPAPKPAGGR
ncbi:hypothetical protein [Sphingomonas sp.]|jgi:cytochrome c5|uniref:hypothetical protein n=1 Tax=Sphingomonas sp. TaxID=28214 RepID=UPI002ED8FDB3